MAVTITHVFLWGSSATNHIENALMGSPCCLPNKLFSPSSKFRIIGLQNYETKEQ
jgi:hypothetical protein